MGKSFLVDRKKNVKDALEMFENKCGSCIYWCSFMDAYPADEYCQTYDAGFCDCEEQVLETTNIRDTCAYWSGA